MPTTLSQFKDFLRGSSYAATKGNSSYHGLQVTVEKEFAGGLNFLGTYTWSKTLSDAADLLTPGALSRRDTALQTFQVSESTVIMVWLVSIFGMSSTSAAVTNFLSARASASCQMPQVLRTGWLEGGALCGAPPFKAANRLPLVAVRGRPPERGAMLSLLRGKARHPDHIMRISS